MKVCIRNSPSSMPVELQIIRASEFVRLDVHAHLDFEESKKALQGLVVACCKRGLNRALLDLRSLPVLPKPQFTPAELGALVATFRDAGFSRRHRLAILYLTDVHHGIRTFAFVNRLRGLQVQAFTDFEDAVNWLSEEIQRRTEREGEAVEIQVGPRGRKAKQVPVVLATRR